MDGCPISYYDQSFQRPESECLPLLAHAYPAGYNRPRFDSPDDPRLQFPMAHGGIPLPGDVLIAPRFGYGHYGIHVGGWQVAHYVKTGRVTVQITSMADFVGTGKWFKVVLYNSTDSFHPDQVIHRVLQTLGWGQYHFFLNNCEHWAHWCKTGRCECEQIGMAGVVRQKVKYKWDVGQNFQLTDA